MITQVAVCPEMCCRTNIANRSQTYLLVSTRKPFQLVPDLQRKKPRKTYQDQIEDGSFLKLGSMGLSEGFTRLG